MSIIETRILAAEALPSQARDVASLIERGQEREAAHFAMEFLLSVMASVKQEREHVEAADVIPREYWVQHGVKQELAKIMLLVNRGEQSHAEKLRLLANALESGEGQQAANTDPANKAAESVSRVTKPHQIDPALLDEVDAWCGTSARDGGPSTDQYTLLKAILAAGGRLSPEDANVECNFNWSAPVDNCKKMVRRINKKLSEASHDWRIKHERLDMKIAHLATNRPLIDP